MMKVAAAATTAAAAAAAAATTTVMVTELHGIGPGSTNEKTRMHG